MTARRRTRPAPRWLAAMTQASTPQQRLAVSYDRLRAFLAYLVRPQRDAAARQAGARFAGQVADEAAAALERVWQAARKGEVMAGDSDSAA